MGILERSGYASELKFGSESLKPPFQVNMPGVVLGMTKDGSLFGRTKAVAAFLAIKIPVAMKNLQTIIVVEE